MLHAIAQVDDVPYFIERWKKTPPELAPVRSGSWRFVGTVLKDDFCLAEMSTQSLPRAQEDRCCIGQPSIGKELGVCEKSFQGTLRDALLW
jgi:hypothetical protein